MSRRKLTLRGNSPVARLEIIRGHASVYLNESVKAMLFHNQRNRYLLASSCALQPRSPKRGFQHVSAVQRGSCHWLRSVAPPQGLTDPERREAQLKSESPLWYEGKKRRSCEDSDPCPCLTPRRQDAKVRLQQTWADFWRFTQSHDSSGLLQSGAENRTTSQFSFPSWLSWRLGVKHYRSIDREGVPRQVAKTPRLALISED
jgi:hypothetical protein